MARCGQALRVKDGYLRAAFARTPNPRQVDVLAAFVAAGGSVADAAALVGIRPSTAKRHLADLRARSGLTTEQLIYCGRAEGWLRVPPDAARDRVEPTAIAGHPEPSSEDEAGDRHTRSVNPYLGVIALNR